MSSSHPNTRTEVPIPPPPPPPACQGVRFSTISSRVRSDNVAMTVDGFYLLIGEAMRTKARYFQQRQHWKYGNSGIGALEQFSAPNSSSSSSSQKKKEASSTSSSTTTSASAPDTTTTTTTENNNNSSIVWILHDSPFRPDRPLKAHYQTPEQKAQTDPNHLSGHVFFQHVHCRTVAMDHPTTTAKAANKKSNILTQTMCETCLNESKSLLTKARQKAEALSKSVTPKGRRDFMINEDPALLLAKIAEQSKQIKYLQSNLCKNKNKVNEFKAEAKKRKAEEKANQTAQGSSNSNKKSKGDDEEEKKSDDAEQQGQEEEEFVIHVDPTIIRDNPYLAALQKAHNYFNNPSTATADAGASNEGDGDTNQAGEDEADDGDQD